MPITIRPVKDGPGTFAAVKEREGITDADRAARLKVQQFPLRADELAGFLAALPSRAKPGDNRSFVAHAHVDGGAQRSVVFEFTADDGWVLLPS
jgi:hypothetical protein